MSMPGDRVLAVLEAMSKEGTAIAHKQIDGKDTYTFGDERYQVTVSIDPTKWIGLKFRLRNSKLSFPINTDLYKPADPENKQFIDEIEEDIVSFLQALQAGRIKIAFKNKRPMALIPLKNEVVLLKQGRFISTSKTYKSTDGIKSIEEFKLIQLMP